MTRRPTGAARRPAGAGPARSQAAGRVIAGSARGIRLVAPESGVRPLGDRLKQAVFAMLEPGLRGRPFLDVFAGAGAAGIEALSRGASAAIFVEAAAGAIAAIERNLQTTRLAGERARIVRTDAVSWLAGGEFAGGPFAVAFLDPPYDRPDLLLATLGRIGRAGPDALVAADGVVAAKHPSRTPPPAQIGLLASARERRVGESTVTLYRWSVEEAG